MATPVQVFTLPVRPTGTSALARVAHDATAIQEVFRTSAGHHARVSACAGSCRHFHGNVVLLALSGSGWTMCRVRTGPAAPGTIQVFETLVGPTEMLSYAN